MQLRSYQIAAIEKLRACYASGKRAPLLVTPTGSGKTLIAAAVIRSAIEKGNRSIFLVPRIELLHQGVAKLRASGLTDIRTIQADRDIGNENAPVIVGSIPTLTTERWLAAAPDAKLVVVDEAHHCKAPTHERLLELYRDAWLLGLSATPQRADGRALGDVFDSLVVGATVAELVTLGHLVPCRVWAPSSLPDNGQIAMQPSVAYSGLAMGRKAIVFCSNVEQCEDIAASFPVPAAAVHGNLSNAERADRLSRFARGELLALTSVHVLSEGFDEPSAEVCIMTRKPEHAGTFLQCVGRVLRPSPGKRDALLIDLGGAVWLHGTPDAERRYSLDGQGINADRLPLRQCPTCGGVFLAPADRLCPQCRAALPKMSRAEMRAAGLDVAEVKERLAPADILMKNLLDAARRTRRSVDWAQRAHAAIMGRKAS